MVQNVVPFGKIWVWALGPVEQSLFELCMAYKTCEGHWGQNEAALSVCIAWSWHCRLWPSSSSRWPVSLWAAATSHSFGRLNENAPWCSKVLIWIFIKLQLCIFYLSLIHLASWDITVLHSNYCENICVLILWGLLSLSRISCSYVLCKQNKTADALPENEAYSHFILQTVKYFWDADS